MAVDHVLAAQADEGRPREGKVELDLLDRGPFRREVERRLAADAARSRGRRRCRRHPGNRRCAAPGFRPARAAATKSRPSIGRLIPAYSLGPATTCSISAVSSTVARHRPGDIEHGPGCRRRPARNQARRRTQADDAAERRRRADRAAEIAAGRQRKHVAREARSAAAGRARGAERRVPRIARRRRTRRCRCWRRRRIRACWSCR